MKTIFCLTTVLLSCFILQAQTNTFPSTGNVGIATGASPNPALINGLQIGLAGSTSQFRVMIPGIYNFEKARFGQYDNGAAGLEFINHVSSTNSYGVRLIANSDQVAGLQFQYAPNKSQETGASGLVYSTAMFMRANDGNIGIGTTAPETLLHIKGNNTNTNANISLETNNAVAKWQLVSVQSTNNFAIIDAASGNTAPFVINKGTPNNTMNLTNNGSVLISQNSVVTPGAYKLEVGGAARANKVVVNTTGADFVFDSLYKLRDLTEVEAFIDSSKHLPDIAPAAEMQKEGLDLGENQTKLLQKIEELTLYLIEQKKRIEQLSKEVAELKKRN